MATPTQSQSYQGGNPYPPPSSQGGQAGPPQSAGGYANEQRPTQSAQGHYGGQQQQQPPQFEKYCVLHVATTCDEHGVYVTKDSAEVIELGWTTVDARDLNLPEVCITSRALQSVEELQSLAGNRIAIF